MLPPKTYHTGLLPRPYWLNLIHPSCSVGSHSMPQCLQLYQMSTQISHSISVPPNLPQIFFFPGLPAPTLALPLFPFFGAEAGDADPIPVDLTATCLVLAGV